MPRCLAIIPARGGSKGIPGKNLARLGGIPLIAWTIAAAKSCPLVDRVLVSTDDPTIADAARQAGAEAPFLRPASISHDTASSIDAVRHAVSYLAEHEGDKPDIVALLQPTSPFRTGSDLTAALELLKSSGADGLISVVKVRHHPAYMKAMQQDGSLVPIAQRPATGEPRQALPHTYAPNGSIYLVRTSTLETGGDWSSGRCVGYVMEDRHSIDIDEPWDLELARMMVDAGVHLLEVGR
jgi:CMP-N,N'-diacetyllegionaminic acid synthase